MILGRSLLHWLIVIVVAICIFILAKWLVPILFGIVVGVTIPGQIVIVIALLTTLAWVYGGYTYPSRNAP